MLSNDFQVRCCFMVQNGSWSFNIRLCITVIRRETGREDKRQAPTVCTFLKKIFLKVPPYSFCLHHIGQKLVTSPSLVFQLITLPSQIKMGYVTEGKDIDEENILYISMCPFLFSFPPSPPCSMSRGTDCCKVHQSSFALQLPFEVGK